MKIITCFALIALLFITCTKEKNDITAVASTNQQPDAAVWVPPNNIPIDELGTSQYNRYTGGLYPGGVNIPSGTYAADLLSTCNGIVPLDASGIPNPTKGYVIFISLGASTGGKNMTALIDKTNGNPLVNPRLKAMNGNQPAGLAPLNYIADPKNVYWSHVSRILNGHKSSFKQVQIVYLETDDSSQVAKFPDRPIIVKNDIEAAIRTMMVKFPNLKVVYVLARTRTFNNGTPWNREPSPYHFGWSCKWAIEDQINGVAGTQYKGVNKVAPMLAWGFYQWADSLPRKTDNFYWRWSETKDGLHANDVGQDTLSTRFQKFLLSNPYASLWYAKH